MAPTRINLWHNGTVNGATPTPKDIQRLQRQRSFSENAQDAKNRSLVHGREASSQGEKKKLKKRSDETKERKKGQGTSKICKRRDNKEVKKKTKPGTGISKPMGRVDSVMGHDHFPQRLKPVAHLPWETMALLNETEQAGAILMGIKYGSGPWCLPDDYERTRLSRYRVNIDGEETEDDDLGHL